MYNWLRHRLILAEIEITSLGIPEPENLGNETIDEALIMDELDFNRDEERSETLKAIEKMNPDQKIFFDAVMNGINSPVGGIFFLMHLGAQAKLSF